jgi:hypothetical protein
MVPLRFYGMLLPLCIFGVKKVQYYLLWLPEWEEGLCLFLNLEFPQWEGGLHILQPQMIGDRRHFPI